MEVVKLWHLDGGYKPAKQIFGQGRQEHAATTMTAVPPKVLHRMTQIERAVEGDAGRRN